MPQLVLQPSLTLLARLLGEALGGDNVPRTEISPELVALALRRHEVGGMLHAVAASGRHDATDAVRTALAQAYAGNVAWQATVRARLSVIARQFQAGGISWITLKGLPMAERLYPDPAWRSSADIDMLVEPAQFSRATRILQDLGYIASNPPLAANPVLRRLTLAAVRDLKLIASDDGRCAIEIHQRLFFAKGGRLRALRLPVAPGAMPSATLGPELALYLVMHGAGGYWVRLKWLLDLVPLLTGLDDGDKRALLRLAAATRTEASLAASLWLLQSLFAFVPLGPLAPWTEARKSDPKVQARAQRYCEMLNLDRDWRKSPLDNRNLSLEATWNLFEAPSLRLGILLFGPVSSLARRIAGSAFKAERALSHSDVPP